MSVKNILYVRSGPYKPVISDYNMQELGFAKAALKHGISTDVVYFSDENKIDVFREENNAKIRVIWAKGYKILRTGYYPQLLDSSFLKKYDLIVVTEFSQIMTYLISKKTNKCVLYSGPYYNLFKIPFIEPVYDLLFTKKINRQIRKIFVKSTLANDYLTKKGYSNISTLGVGLDTEKFDSESQIKEGTEDIVNYVKSNRCLLFVGTLCDRKNFPFVLEVFTCLKKKYSSDLKLVLIGNGPDNYVKKYLNALDPEVRDEILHVKKVENAQLRFIYENNDMFILPSKLEIFGMVLLEAMYFGNCVFTTVNGGSTTLIKSEENGFVFDSFDVESWAKKIEQVNTNRELLKMVKAKARATIADGFTWDKIIEKFDKELPDELTMNLGENDEQN